MRSYHHQPSPNLFQNIAIYLASNVCYIDAMQTYKTLRKRLLRVVSAALCTATMLGTGLPVTHVSAAASDPLPHAPLPAYVNNYPKPTITFDPSDGATDLAPWFNSTVLPLLSDWYPVIADNVIGAPTDCSGSPCYPLVNSFTIKSESTYTGIAETRAGNVIVFNPNWVRSNQPGTPGVFIHEMTHVVHQGHSSPFWFQEGLADYIRVYIYQDMYRASDPNATYLNGYTDSANFVNYINSVSPGYVQKMAYATYRTGIYTPSYTTTLTGTSLETHWKNFTGHSITTINNLKPNNALSRCVDLNNWNTADGSRPDIWDCVAQDNERWVALDQDKTTGGMIQSVYGAKCLRVNTAVKTSGGYAVDYAYCNSTSTAQKFLHRSDGTVYNAATNRCMRPVSSGTTNGTKLEVTTCNAKQTSQKWTWSVAL